MTRKSVCAAKRDDAECGRRFAIFGDEPLKDLVDGAVASAGEDDVYASENSLPCL